MSERPRWTIRLVQGLDDVIGEDDYTDADDPLYDELESAVNAILCAKYGHDIIDDMCRIPEHRYCAYCGRSASRCGDQAWGPCTAEASE
jgi:hypothetical protein